MGTQTKFPDEVFSESASTSAIGRPDADDTGEIYEQAWFTLVQIRRLLELNRPVGYLSEQIEYKLQSAATSLEHIFPRPAEEPDIAF